MTPRPGKPSSTGLVRDAQAALAVLDGHELDGSLAQAGDLLGLVAGQDVAAGEDGIFRIVRRVARDRLISTVDVQARHGHKSRARTFDGYKSHLGIDPDDELITGVAVTPANTRDRDVIDELLDEPVTGEPTDGDQGAAVTDDPAADSSNDSAVDSGAKDIEVYGDSAYADGATLEVQTARGRDMRTKVPPVRNPNGYSKDHFTIDLAARTVTCPAEHTVSIGKGACHRTARFGALCASCPLRARARGGANDAIRSLLQLAPPMAQVLRDGEPVEIPTEQVVAGDLLLIRPGADDRDVGVALAEQAGGDGDAGRAAADDQDLVFGRGGRGVVSSIVAVFWCAHAC